MANLFSNISLRFKISAIGATGVLGLIVVAAIYFTSRSVQDSIEMAMETATSAKAHTQDVEIYLLQARRAEKNFQLRRQLQYLEQHAAAIRNATASLDKVAQELGSSSPLAAEIKTLRTGIADYARQFGILSSTQKTLGLTEEDGLQGSLRKSVHAVEANLKNYSEPHLTVLMLTMRRHGKDFMLRSDPKYADEMKKRVEEFEKAIARPIETAETLHATVDTFIARVRAA